MATGEVRAVWATLMIVAALSLTSCAAEASQADPAPVEVEQARELPSEGGTSSAYTANVPELPAGLSSEELGQQTIDTFSEWNNAGTDDSLRQEIVANAKSDSPVPIEDIIANRADINKVAYSEALLTTEYASNPALVEFVDTMENANFSILDWFRSTEWNQEDPANIEGYERYNEVVAVTELPDDNPNDALRTLQIDTVSSSNSDKNSAPDESPINGRYIVTYEAVGSSEEIIDVKISGR